MANVQIPNLPAVAALSGAELFEGVQAGTSVKISLDQIIAATQSGTPTTLPIPVGLGGTGVSTITGYIKGSGTTPFTGSATIPNTDITGLGTMSTQNADAVAITGGSITGITDLAVADGGTGASDAAGARTNLGLGTMSTQNANTVSITGGSITGITDLAVADGGTGQGNPLTQYGLIYGSTTTAMASTAAGTSTQVLHGNASGAPTFSAVSLTADVSGTLPVANGGTGVTTAPAAAAVLMGFTTTATASGTTVLTNASSQFQLFTGTLTQTITLPVTSTLGTGWSFHIANNSTGTLTVNSSGGNLVISVIAGLSAMVTCIGTTLTTAADWEAGFTDFQSATGTGSVVLGTGPTITSGALNGTLGATTPSTIAGTTGTFTGIVSVTVSSASDAVRITQTGAGNALLVEDSANPDSTPFVVTATGAVGIGTTSPAEELQVRFDNASGLGAVVALANVNSSGATGNQVGIGLSAFTDLAINSASYRGTTIVAETSASGNSHDLIFSTSTTSAAPAERLRITSTGSLILAGSTAQKATGTTWSNPSDQRLKHNITNYPKGIPELMQVRVCEWEYNGKGGTVEGEKGIGVIADEVMTILPNTVETYDAKLNAEDKKTTAIKKFDATEITWLLVKAVQEQQAIITALEARLSALEAQ